MGSPFVVRWPWSDAGEGGSGIGRSVGVAHRDSPSMGCDAVAGVVIGAGTPTSRRKPVFLHRITMSDTHHHGHIGGAIATTGVMCRRRVVVGLWRGAVTTALGEHPSLLVKTGSVGVTP